MPSPISNSAIIKNGKSEGKTTSHQVCNPRKLELKAASGNIIKDIVIHNVPQAINIVSHFCFNKVPPIQVNSMMGKHLSYLLYACTITNYVIIFYMFNLLEKVTIVRISKKTFIISCIVLVTFFFSVTYELPYYIYKPGKVDELDDVVEIEGGRHDQGHLHLVTVSGSKATPIQYVAAKMFAFHEIIPAEDARPEGITDDEYLRHQLKLMENSQNASKFVAYEAADKEATINFHGVYVINVVDDMPAQGHINIGDEITKVDDEHIEKAKDLTEYVGKKQAGDTLQIELTRDDKEVTETVEVVEFPDEEGKVGIGIQLVTNEQVDVSPPIVFESGNIGGPSAGFVFALEIYNQLTDDDITKGYDIVGTGEIDYEGNVHRIGGIDKKVVAADRAGMDLFFAPNEQGDADSNYIEAQQTAEEIDTDMEIIPIDTFEEAIDYLEQMNNQ